MKPHAPWHAPGMHWRRLHGLTTSWLVAGVLGFTGCQTFRYTHEDLQRERHRIAKGHVNWFGAWSPLAGFEPTYFDPRYHAPEGFEVLGIDCRRGSLSPAR